jgi:hypothetical protein
LLAGVDQARAEYQIAKRVEHMCCVTAVRDRLFGVAAGWEIGCASSAQWTVECNKTECLSDEHRSVGPVNQREKVKEDRNNEVPVRGEMKRPRSCVLFMQFTRGNRAQLCTSLSREIHG